MLRQGLHRWSESLEFQALNFWDPQLAPRTSMSGFTSGSLRWRVQGFSNPRTVVGGSGFPRCILFVNACFRASSAIRLDDTDPSRATRRCLTPGATRVDGPTTARAERLRGPFCAAPGCLTRGPRHGHADRLHIGYTVRVDSFAAETRSRPVVRWFPRYRENGCRHVACWAATRADKTCW